MRIFPRQIQLEFVEAGLGQVAQDGWLHKKTCPHSIVAQAIEGAYEISIGGAAPVLLQQGEAFLSPPGVPLEITHHCNQKTKMFRMRWLHFDFKIHNAIDFASVFDFPSVVNLPWAEHLGEITERINGLQNCSVKGNQLPLKVAIEMSQLSYEFLGILLDYLENSGATGRFEPEMERFLPALVYMDQHCDKPLVVTELARLIHLSVPRFHAEFKRLFGTTPMKHLKQIRMNKAGDLLSSTDLAIHEIALKTGFCNQFHLSREFQHFYGEPPTKYRISGKHHPLANHQKYF